MRLVAAVMSGVLAAACGQSEPDRPADPPAAAAAATAAEHRQDAPVPTPVAATPPSVAVIEQQVAYGEADEANLIGYLAMPGDAVEPLPGLLVIHEWWGLNDNIKALTRRLAGDGYVALAVDLYGHEVADEPAAAQALMERAGGQPDALRDNLRQAYEYLSRHAFAPKVGAIGWCFGGGWALQTALAIDELDAVVMYYGTVVADRSQLAVLNAPLLGIFAERDELVPAADVESFRRMLRDLGKDADIRIVPGVDHAFANPSGGNYAAAAAEEAWAATREFLARHLQR